MKAQIFIPIVLLLAGITGGCEEKKEDPVLVKGWERLEAADHSLGSMNSRVYQEKLHILTPSSIYRFTSEEEYDVFLLGDYEKAGRLKFPVGNGFTAYTDAGSVIIKSLAGSPETSISKTVNMQSHDPEFRRFADIPYWQGQCLVIEGNEILVPYEAIQVNTPRFVRIVITPPVTSDAELDILSVEVLKDDPAPGVISVYTMQNPGDSYFITMGGATFRINNEGSMTQIADRWLNVIAGGPVLHAFAYSYESVEYWTSGDSGVTWVNAGEVEPALYQLHYSLLSGRIIGFAKSQLFELTLTENAYSLKELNNQGLSKADITSIAMANDSTVVVTTRCNSLSDECGVYTISWGDLFETDN